MCRKEWSRRPGIGTLLMKTMLTALEGKGYPKVSLSVQKENYAVTWYRKLGFEVVRETTEEYIMVKEF